jgi:hypothetical protein
MSKEVADVLWEMLAKAGVKRCFRIAGDALNPSGRTAPKWRETWESPEYVERIGRA